MGPLEVEKSQGKTERMSTYTDTERMVKTVTLACRGTSLQ